MNGLSKARIVYYATILVMAPLLIYLFAGRDMRFFKVPSRSMEPTLQPGDYLLTLAKEQYGRGDVVVLADPEEPGAFIVKRIVGVPGDTVSLDGGALYLNGAYASEPYIAEPMLQRMRTLTVPEDGVFVLGDNRNHSEDGTEWGKALPENSIVGEVKLRYLPLDRFGPLRSFPLRNSHGA